MGETVFGHQDVRWLSGGGGLGNRLGRIWIRKKGMRPLLSTILR